MSNCNISGKKRQKIRVLIDQTKSRVWSLARLSVNHCPDYVQTLVADLTFVQPLSRLCPDFYL